MANDLDIFSNQYSDLIYLNEIKKIPFVCDYTKSNLSYKAYQTCEPYNNNKKFITDFQIYFTNTLNSLYVNSNGAYSLLPYFFVYRPQSIERADLMTVLVSTELLPDYKIKLTLPTYYNISFNYKYSTFLEIIRIDTTLISLTKILNISKDDNINYNVYTISLEFIPDFNVVDILSMEIVFCEVLYPISFGCENNTNFKITWMMSETYKEYGDTGIEVTTIDNCYDIFTKELLCNCAGNSINSSTIFNKFSKNNLITQISSDAIYNFINIDNSIENKNIKKNELIVEDFNNCYVMPAIIKNKAYKIIKNPNILEKHNMSYINNKIRITNTPAQAFTAIYSNTIYSLFVNGIENTTFTTGSILEISGTSFLKYDNIITIVYKEDYQLLQTFLTGIIEDHIIRVPVCVSDFFSMESLKNVDTISVSTQKDTKEKQVLTTKYNNQLTETTKINNKISLTEKEVNRDNISLENQLLEYSWTNRLYFGLEKSNNYSLISLNMNTGLTKIFQNCQLDGSSLVEGNDVNTKQFDLVFDNEIKYINGLEV